MLFHPQKQYFSRAFFTGVQRAQTTHRYKKISLSVNLFLYTLIVDIITTVKIRSLIYILTPRENSDFCQPDTAVVARDSVGLSIYQY